MLDCDKITYQSDSYAPIQGAKNVLSGVSSVAKTLTSTFNMFGSGDTTDKGDVTTPNLMRDEYGQESEKHDFLSKSLPNFIDNYL